MGTASVRATAKQRLVEFGASAARGLAVRADAAGMAEEATIVAPHPSRSVLKLVGAGDETGAGGFERSTSRQAEDASSPRSAVRNVLLIGTSRAVAGLEMQLNGRSGVSLAGRVTVDGRVGSAAQGREEWGGKGRTTSWTLDRLDAALDTLRPDAAIVALPSGRHGLVETVERSLEARAVAYRRVPVVEEVLEDLRVEREHAHRSAGGKSAGAGRGHSAVLVPRVIDFAELIGRVPYEPDRRAVSRVITGKRVLITGAGGSIGSELARVACQFEPSEIILMERSENALFEIDRQMASRWPEIARRAVLHDVVEAERTRAMLRRFEPHVVFHAAAHKHVPLMEDHPSHAVVNNLLGTKAIADAAAACGAERFVMISSDKAVNPTSVMGATKRMAELYVRWLGTQEHVRATRMSMVRFGNVLGSAASVLTIWGTQLAEGGPLTVTDPRMTRYFMTIPEAATLVIQSAALEPSAAADRGQAGMYVLDMGEPIRILDLAVRFVRAHGLRVRLDASGALRVAEPSVRAEIEEDLAAWRRTRADTLAGADDAHAVDLLFSGARPGEKLHEELAYAAELLRPTDHPGVRAWAGEGELGDVPGMVAQMTRLVAEDGPAGRVVEAIRGHVPEMRSKNRSGKC